MVGRYTFPWERVVATQLSFSPDGRLVCVLDSNGHVCVWHVAEGSVVMAFDGPAVLASPASHGNAPRRAATSNRGDGGNDAGDDNDGESDAAVAEGWDPPHYEAPPAADSPIVGIDWWSRNALVLLHKGGMVRSRHCTGKLRPSMALTCACAVGRCWRVGCIGGVAGLYATAAVPRRRRERGRCVG